MTTAIQVNDLHYTYEGQDGGETHIVFDGLSLSIEQGSFVAVLGHNGCGKSTLGRTVLGLLDATDGRTYSDDAQTRAAVLTFQARRGLDRDGIAGGMTWGALLDRARP